MKNIARLPLLLLFTLCLAGAVTAATFAVNTVSDTADLIPGDGNCVDASANCSLRAAISEANALAGADTINVPQGDYIQGLAAANEDANAGGDWDVSGDLTITSTGPGPTSFLAAVTPGTATERVLDIRSGTVTLNQIAFMNGRFTGTMTPETRGAGIQNLGRLTLNFCTVSSNLISSSNAFTYGGGIYNGGASLTLNNTQVTNNTVTAAAGGIALGGGLASTSAAAILINNSSLSENTVGGGTSTQSFAAGGGMYVESTFNVTVSNSHFDNNFSQSSTSLGGGLYAVAGAGAAVLNVTNSTFNVNTTAAPIGVSGSSRGAGIMLSTVSGAANTLGATLNGVTVDGNMARTGNGIGIAVTIGGGNLTLNVANSTISNSQYTIIDGGSGGGVNIFLPASATSNPVGTINFTNTTIASNQGVSNGGGVYALRLVETVGTIRINFNFCTIAGNFAGNGGGLYSNVPDVTSNNSIFADNDASTGPDIFSRINAVDFNHIESKLGVQFTGNGPHNTFGFDPQLGPLQNNGGATQTKLLAAASPLVNVIPNGFGDCGTTFTTDQRRLPRPALSRCDIGAAELQSFPGGPFTVSGTVMTEGGIPIRNIVVVLSEGGLATPRFTVTGSLGNYIFTDVPANGYTISISSKRFFFAEDGKFINVFNDLGGINFSGTAATERGILLDLRQDAKGK